MSITIFTKKENSQMLWDVISDEDNFRFLSPDIQSKVYNLFINNIQGFYEVERTKTNSLVDINKKYILLILNHIRKTYPYQPSKIVIHNETPIKELITFSDIKNTYTYISNIYQIILEQFLLLMNPVEPYYFYDFNELSLCN
jgi:hypothetical protein